MMIKILYKLGLLHLSGEEVRQYYAIRQNKHPFLEIESNILFSYCFFWVFLVHYFSLISFIAWGVGKIPYLLSLLALFLFFTISKDYFLPQPLKYSRLMAIIRLSDMGWVKKIYKKVNIAYKLGFYKCNNCGLFWIRLKTPSGKYLVLYKGYIQKQPAQNAIALIKENALTTEVEHEVCKINIG